VATLNYHRQGTGEPLLLAHGIGSRWQVWLPVLERLAAERDVIAVDLPGYGASPPSPPGTPPGIASLTDALESFLDDLRSTVERSSDRRDAWRCARRSRAD
jgi:pimeloyl-ACP methyl ester carboxylesterase